MQFNLSKCQISFLNGSVLASPYYIIFVLKFCIHTFLCMFVNITLLILLCFLLWRSFIVWTAWTRYFVYISSFNFFIIACFINVALFVFNFIFVIIWHLVCIIQCLYKFCIQFLKFCYQQNEMFTLWLFLFVIPIYC